MSRLLTRDELFEILSARRRAGTIGRVVLANGCFEVLHPGRLARPLREPRPVTRSPSRRSSVRSR